MLVGLIALIGLLSQRKSLTEILSGTIKTIVGFTILNAGADLVAMALAPIGKIFAGAFGLSGLIPNNEATVSYALKSHGGEAALILGLGMLVNILMARLTRFKFIFLTGHLALYMATMLAMLLGSLGYSGALLIITGGLALGLLMSVLPALADPYMEKITGSSEIALGNFGTLGYVLSAALGKIWGRAEDSTEEIRLPRRLAFFKEGTVSITLIMALIYLVIALLAGPTFIEAELSQGEHYLVYALLQAILFAAGVFIIMQGVTLVLEEIVPAFRGISERYVPSAKPALDGPVVYPYAPNAVLIGFVSSFTGGLVALAFLLIVGSRVIVPGLVAHFFCGATSAVFGNVTGGRRGAILGAFLNGILFTLLPGLLYDIIPALQAASTSYSDTDFVVSGLLLKGLGRVLRPGGLTALLIALILLSIVRESWRQVQRRRGGR